MDFKNSIKQDEFLQRAFAGENIFLSGKAGTGKTYIVKELIRILKENGRNVMAVAPTGIAANNIGGATLHSTFAIQPFGVLDFESCNYLKPIKRVMLNIVDTLIIDEVSMVRPDILDAINWTLLKNRCKGIEKIQVIFVGDMKQLGIVADDNMMAMLLSIYSGSDFTKAQIYPKLNVQTIELDVPQRQSDPEFIEALNVLRDGGKSDYFKQFVSDSPQGVILAPHNATVQRYNNDGLNSLDGDKYTFDAVIEGKVKANDFNVDEKIEVKDGCKIMYLVNSKNNNLFNGTLGVFRVIDKGTEFERYFIEVGTVRYALEQQIFAKRDYVLNKEENQLELVEIGSITQIPIKLAYALTIHKSQGLTFDEVTIDLCLPCFAPGQMYVAFSRVRSPKGLRIITKSKH